MHKVIHNTSANLRYNLVLNINIFSLHVFTISSGELAGNNEWKVHQAAKRNSPTSECTVLIQHNNIYFTVKKNAYS